MRVLMVSDVYFPRVNGVSTSIQTFRHALSCCGVEVTLVAPAYEARPETVLPDTTSDRIMRISSRPVPRDPEDHLMRWRDLMAFKKTLKPGQFDVVHIQTPFLAHYAGLKFARALNVPAIATYHTLFEEYLHHYVPFIPKGAMRGLARHCSRMQCNALDAVIVPSRAMHERLLAYGVEAPMRVLPTGMPESAFVEADGAGFRRKHGIAQDRPVALFVGRVAHEKNIGFLLQALQQAVKQRPEMLLIIAGDGPAREGLREEVIRMGLSSQVLFLGYLDRQSELPGCYAAADLFVFSSLTETQGLVLLEAMAAGTPVLALSEMGTKDILDVSHSASVSENDATQFGMTMAKLLSDRKSLAERGVQAREEARQWSDLAMAHMLAGLYADLSGRACGKRLEEADLQLS